MKKYPRIYMDYAASIEANPSSIHFWGLIANKKLQNARQDVAGVLNARKEEIIFTSGGTEGNNLAIQGVVFATQMNKNFVASPSLRGLRRELNFHSSALPHIITTNIEHPSVLETYKLLEKRKLAQISIVPVEPNGIVDPKKIKKELKNNTILVSVMYANNEIGTIQPIKEIAKEIRHFKKAMEKKKNFSYFPILHTDAVQAVNYLDLNVEKLGVDMLTLSGSKIENAGRVGILYKKKSVPISPLFGGGDQEMGLRPGTENLSAILKFSSALVSVEKNKEKENKRLVKLRDYFLKKLEHSNILKNSGMIVNGDLVNRLPNNVNITVPNVPSDLLVIELSEKGIMASPKSACKSSSSLGSYVIDALRSTLGPKSNPEIGGVRFSFGKATTKKDIDYTALSLEQILVKLKKWY